MRAAAVLALKDLGVGRTDVVGRPSFARSRILAKGAGQSSTGRMVSNSWDVVGLTVTAPVLGMVADMDDGMAVGTDAGTVGGKVVGVAGVSAGMAAEVSAG